MLSCSLSVHTCQPWELKNKQDFKTEARFWGRFKETCISWIVMSFKKKENGYIICKISVRARHYPVCPPLGVDRTKPFPLKTSEIYCKIIFPLHFSLCLSIIVNCDQGGNQERVMKKTGVSWENSVGWWISELHGNNWTRSHRRSASD